MQVTFYSSWPDAQRESACGRMFDRLVGRLLRRAVLGNGAIGQAGEAREPPLRFGEVVAAATVPDFANLPLEFWPGYREWAASGRAAARRPWDRSR
jgi:hypothetical protein